MKNNIFANVKKVLITSVAYAKFMTYFVKRSSEVELAEKYQKEFTDYVNATNKTESDKEFTD